MLKWLIASVKRQGWGTLLLWLLMVAPAYAELELRVAIKQNIDTVTVGSSTSAVVKDSSGQTLGQIPAMGAFTAQFAAGRVAINQWLAGLVWIEPQDDGYVYIGDRWYRGRTLLIPSTAGLTAVNYVDLEQYLYSVVGAEMGGSWPQEALKAQAVAARSYALYKRQRSTNALYDLVGTQASQVYQGLIKEAVGTHVAVEATAGQVITHNGQIIDAVFHACSGGHTENVENVWTHPLPYLRGVPDFDQGTHESCQQWDKSVSAAEFGNLFPNIGNLLSIEYERTPWGRVKTLQVIGDGGTQVMRGDELRKSLGLRSTLFSVFPLGGEVASIGTVTSAPISFQFTGRGYGHGIGMSQWGAFSMAKQGYDYRQILGHYYSGVELAEIQVE
ncbi:MAG: SpoIID/LytB domain-containing protein [Cyanothece sp. SIO1E1]|nr:SpoIID/LytB domain-containing protein [Cyanothece sp. SIO1E1]